MEQPIESPSLPSRRRPWSLYFLILWAFVLAFNTGITLWDLTGPLAQFGSPDTAVGWLGLALAFIAPFGFGASVYGLWALRPWGRYLFLVLSTLFFGFNLVGVWLPGGLPLAIQDSTHAINARLLASIRYGLALIIPLVYFNLSWIKPLFQESGESLSEPGHL
ncbi:MAG: hypothetical protein P8186_03695 [Anaerolineae bacterium]